MKFFSCLQCRYYLISCIIAFAARIKSVHFINTFFVGFSFVFWLLNGWNEIKRTTRPRVTLNCAHTLAQNLAPIYWLFGSYYMKRRWIHISAVLFHAISLSLFTILYNGENFMVPKSLWHAITHQYRNLNRNHFIYESALMNDRYLNIWITISDEVIRIHTFGKRDNSKRHLHCRIILNLIDANSLKKTSAFEFSYNQIMISECK